MSTAVTLLGLSAASLAGCGAAGGAQAAPDHLEGALGRHDDGRDDQLAQGLVGRAFNTRATSDGRPRSASRRQVKARSWGTTSNAAATAATSPAAVAPGGPIDGRNLTTPLPGADPVVSTTVPIAVRDDVWFSLRRPFPSDREAAASRYYPYGTDANGQYLLHHGVDMAATTGTPVVAVAAGVVVHAGEDADVTWGPEPDFYGQLVVVRHDSLGDGRPLYSLYGHLSDVVTTAGQRVEAGDELGRVGASGVALGPHLHLELRDTARDYGRTLNPELFLAPLPGHGTIVGRVIDGHGRLVPDTVVELFALEPEGARWVSATTTYPARAGFNVNPSLRWQENFVFGDVPVGVYSLSVTGAPEASDAVAVIEGGAPEVVLSQP